jgi:GTP-binding protein Era
MPKSGYIAIIGKPNVGKSTLMNAIIGSKLSIVTPKPQTTRRNVLGIYTQKETQMVFIDTPGVLKPRYELHKSMMNFVEESLSGADIIIVIADVTRPETATRVLTPPFIEALKTLKKPCIAILNKMDALSDKTQALPFISALEELGVFTEFIPISALKKDNTDTLVNILESLLPEAEFFHDPEILSTMPQRFFVSELIRETVFELFKEEIPYSTEVTISEFKEREKGKWYIAADIIIEKESQKAILIGEKGSKIKQIGLLSRDKVEEHLEFPVFLELFVKVREDWRSKTTYLRSFGY